MKRILAARSVSNFELKRSPSTVLEQACAQPAAGTNRNRPAPHLLPPHVYEAMRLHADLRTAIQEGLDSGPALSAEDVFAELEARYAGHGGQPANRASKRSI